MKKEILRTVVIDDEESARDAILKLLKIYCEDVEVIATANSVKTGIEVISEYKPDLVLLDIQLDDGIGFDILSKVNHEDFKIIFITAFHEYAIKAFKFSALDYLLKPLDADDLIAAIDKVKKAIDKENIELEVSTFLNNFHNAKNDKSENNKIVLKTIDKIFSIPVVDIIRCESEGSYTTFYIKDGKKIMVSKNLKEYDELLAGYQFFRSHQSHLFNLNYFDYFNKSDGGYIVLKDGSNVPLSQSKKESFFKLML